jgi:hypothetical protein
VPILHGDSLARGPQLLSIKHYVIEIMIGKLYTQTGNDAKQNLLIIDAENGLISHPSTLECVYRQQFGASSERITL